MSATWLANGTLHVGDFPKSIIEAAGKAGIETVAVITGGWFESGAARGRAAAIFESVDELRRRLDETLFG